MTIAAIEIVDNGSTVNAYEDKEHGRVLAVMQRPRIYTAQPYLITVPRTGERIERRNAGLAYAALKRLAFAEWYAINPEAETAR
jgi:hypothetical protein